MNKSLQLAWIRAAKLHIADNPKIYGRGAVAPSDEAYINFIEEKISRKFQNAGFTVGVGNFNMSKVKQLINIYLDKAIEAEQKGDTNMPISKNARLKVALSLKESLNTGFDI